MGDDDYTQDIYILSNILVIDTCKCLHSIIYILFDIIFTSNLQYSPALKINIKIIETPIQTKKLKITK